MKKLLIIIILSSASLLAQEQESTLNKQMNTQLLQPITVTVGGDFVVNGSFNAVRSQRIDHFITTIFTQAKEKVTASLNQLETIKQIYKGLDRFPLRDITLKRISGEILKVDLLKFRFTGDFKYNPYLMNDDVIIFPAYDDEKNFIDIGGAVNKPVKFQFVDGDKLSDAILFAGGINISYQNINKAEISRLSFSGNKEEILTVDINSDYQLKAGDRIRILADENQKGDYKVLVLGEVKFPGFIYVTKNGSLLKEVIQKAGGFTMNASLDRAEIIRNLNSNQILKKYKIMEEFLDSPEQLLSPDEQFKINQLREKLALARLNNLKLEDSLSFKIDSELKSLGGYQLVDFTKLNDAQSDESNFVLRDGDLILIPEKFDYIYVFGQVAKTGFIKHVPGKDYTYYIDKAGGVSETARDDDEIVVIKNKTLAWYSKEKEKINLEPGDYIYVPKSVPKPFDFYLQRYVNVASIIGSVATIILLFIQFGK